MTIRRISFFSLPLRMLHWTMAAMIITMLLIGITMVSSLADYQMLVSIHRPLGMLILLLAFVRLVVRLGSPLPELPTGMPSVMKQVAGIAHWLLYGLMFALPIVGWAMLSAAAYPIVLYGPIQLPPILPHNVELFAMLRTLHTVLAFALFGTILAHASAAMVHVFIFRDGVLRSILGPKR